MQAHFIGVDDGHLPGTGEEQRDLALAWAEYNMNVWFPHIKHLTFAAQFVSVTSPVALLLFLSGHDTTSEERRAVQELRDALDSKMSAGQQYFVKLGTRSPKDAVDKLEHFDALLFDEVASILIETRGKQPHTNDLVRALKMAFGKSMRVRNGQQALELFARSGRIVSDLVRWRDLRLNVPVYVVVRPFLNIPLWAELRAFVYQRKLTAVSQYFSEMFFPELQRIDIVAHIGPLINQAIQALPVDDGEYNDFIADVVLPFPGQQHAMIMELNPWDTLTGAALFDWKQDAAILKNTDANAVAVVRVRTEIPPNLVITGSWKTAIDKALREAYSDQIMEEEFETNVVEL